MYESGSTRNKQEVTKDRGQGQFKHDKGLIPMIEILKMMRDELDKKPFCVNEERARTNLEISPKRNHWGRAHAMSFKGIKEARGDETKIKKLSWDSSDVFLSMRKWGRKDRGSWQLAARAKAMRLKVGKSTRCRKFVQVLTTSFL